jgi:hypothetical protein
MVSVELKVQSVKPLEISKNTKAVLMSLGATALGALYGAITVALTNLTKQAIDASIAALEKQAAVLWVRSTIATLQASLDQVKSAQADIAPYIKCLELVPEVRTPVVQAITEIDRISSDIKSYLNKLDRLTYMSDLATQLVNQINEKISKLLSAQALIKNLLDELPQIPIIDISITLATLLQYPCTICPPLDPLIKKGREEINKSIGASLL